ncbi:MAG: hypothetical protein M1834_002850 [Cirrosporium novae-zelandiae]|nr:MAG: hypothetical protein M1834_002850 [Cirrosporium novae-zelandiae]
MSQTKQLETMSGTLSRNSPSLLDRFVALPFEVRLIIYSYYFGCNKLHPSSLIFGSDHLFLGDISPSTKSSLTYIHPLCDPQLSNPQIADEAKEVFYSASVFSFRGVDEIPKFIRYDQGRPLQFVRNINVLLHLICGSVTGYDPGHVLYQLLKFERLSSLGITIWPADLIPGPKSLEYLRPLAWIVKTLKSRNVKVLVWKPRMPLEPFRQEDITDWWDEPSPQEIEQVHIDECMEESVRARVRLAAWAALEAKSATEVPDMHER